MSDRDDDIKRREKRIRAEEGGSHGRDPERLDPEMLDGEDAEVVRANKELKRRERGEVDEDPQELGPDERLPPD